MRTAKHHFTWLRAMGPSKVWSCVSPIVPTRLLPCTWKTTMGSRFCITPPPPETKTWLNSSSIAV